MGNIRVVGRARGGRCVFCHDSLGGDVRHCGGCGATWHSDCGVTGCPTLGCSRPTPDAQQRRGATKHMSVEPAHKGKPGLAARVGPYTRLVMSGLFGAAMVTAVVVFFGWVLTHPGGYWEFCMTGKRGRVEPVPLAVLKAVMFLFLPGMFGWAMARWLFALPRVWKEVGQLLDSTTPTAMRLGVFSTGSGKKKRWYATLKALSGGEPLTISLYGLLPPWWLFRQDGKHVLVYGLPPPGPYVLEFEDGWLALVHPDDD